MHYKVTGKFFGIVDKEWASGSLHFSLHLKDRLCRPDEDKFNKLRLLSSEITLNDDSFLSRSANLSRTTKLLTMYQGIIQSNEMVGLKVPTKGFFLFGDVVKE